MRRALISVGFGLVLLAASPTPGRAGVHVGIGIDLPAPPPLVPIPSTPVMYAPAVPANYFFHGGQYWVFAHGVWYVSPGYNGPWTVVAPAYVPPAILTVPVRYYRVRPPAWRRWRLDGPPHWAERHRPPPRGRERVWHEREHPAEHRERR
jgi:hypothetical protein